MRETGNTSHAANGSAIRATAAAKFEDGADGKDANQGGVRRASRKFRATAQLCRDRPGHQQLPVADRAPARRRAGGDRRLFAHRPAGRRVARQRADQRCGDGPHRRGAGDLRRQAAPPSRVAVARGGDRSVSPRRQWRRTGRAGAARDRHRARHHFPSRRGATRGARLSQPDGARRRAGADFRHWRRVDRADARRCVEPGRPDSRLGERAVGGRIADRTCAAARRQPGGASGRLCAYARSDARRLCRLCRSRRTICRTRAAPAGHQRHGDNAGQRVPEPAAL